MPRAAPPGPPRSPIVALVDKVDQLPSIPLVADRIGKLVHDPRIDARRIAAELRTDPAMSVKVLRLVNSPYFAIPGGVSDVERAISFIGFNTLHQLVLTASVFQVFGKDAAAKDLFRHSLAVAGACEALAEIIGVPGKGECFTGGLLHDLGKLALMQVAPQDFSASASRAKEAGVSWSVAETELGLPAHDALGGRLAQRWRFPMGLRAAIEHHHHLETSERRDLAASLHPIVDVTILADAICNRWTLAGTLHHERPLPELVLERLNVDARIEQQARDHIQRAIERSGSMLEILME